MEVYWTDTAAAHLDNIYAYIARDSKISIFYDYHQVC